MTRYVNGRALEYKARDVLVEAGYFVVRSAGSKGPVDLVAMSRSTEMPQLLLVQCKRDGALPPAKWNELLELAMETAAVPVLAEFYPRHPVLWWRLLGRKDIRGPQPMEPFRVGE